MSGRGTLLRTGWFGIAGGLGMLIFILTMVNDTPVPDAIQWKLVLMCCGCGMFIGVGATILHFVRRFLPQEGWAI